MNMAIDDKGESRDFKKLYYSQCNRLQQYQEQNCTNIFTHNGRHFPPENYLILHVRQVIRAEAKQNQKVGGNPKHDEERWQNTQQDQEL